MDRNKITTGAMWTFSVLLALGFLMAGVPKVMMLEVWVGKFEAWGYPAWFLLTIGVLEVIGAAMALIPRTALYGVALLTVIVFGAAYTHIAHDEGMQVLRPIIFFVLLAAVAWLRRPGVARVEVP